MPRYTGFNHIALVTGDMDATVRFWRDLLGLPLVAGLGHAGYRQYFFAVSSVDTVAFFEWDGVTPVAEKDHGAPQRGPVAFDHIALGVASDDDLWDIKARLEGAGFWCSEPVDHGFIHSIYSFDPNGIAIEFSTQVSGVDVRSHPRMTDSAPVPSALEGPAPRPEAWPAPAPDVPQDERRTYPGEGHDFLYAKRNAWEKTS
ncbi:VOC family protein [Nitratidesulfovibrio vulgaris]|uniref:VOC family protein n=1 Tax=Nitratidesulfovibrio vulgaris TaxID=881 RepID=UPI002300DD24|nr:VOC family protein [Nitratidesulfovibrio vulgaris]WCB46441.1 VOC family protein [Nitratidesulfovibrio vulgaris]